MAKPVALFSTLRGSKGWRSSAVFVLIVVIAGLTLPQVMLKAPAVAETPHLEATPGQESLTYNVPSLPEGTDARAMLTRLALGTVLVLGLCVGTLWLGKRWLGVKPLPLGGAERQLRLVEVLPLRGRCCVYLLQAGPRQILVGADACGLRALLPLTDSFEQTLTRASDPEP
jgi:hypothetical protein